MRYIEGTDLRGLIWTARRVGDDRAVALARTRSAFALAVIGLLFVLAAPARADELTVYSSLPLHTPERAVYEDIVRGEQLALEQAGGQAGTHTVRLVSLNDASTSFGSWDPRLTARNALQAARDPSAIAYLGEYNSGATAISLPILNEVGILQISPTNAYVGFTRREAAAPGDPDRWYPTGERTYGRVAPADHLQAAALAALLDREGVDRAFLVDDVEFYGSSLRKMLATRLRRRGITIAGRGALRHRRASAALITRIARSHAQAMVFTGLTRNGAVGLWRKVVVLGLVLNDSERGFPAPRPFGQDSDSQRCLLGEPSGASSGDRRCFRLDRLVARAVESSGERRRKGLGTSPRSGHAEPGAGPREGPAPDPATCR